MNEPDLTSRIIQKLMSHSASVSELALAVGAMEYSVLNVLDTLRAEGRVQCMAGEWSIGERFRAR
jgi:DNA-binding IclR family transcriptional regulator